MKLIIVESPNKRATISQFLPRDYVVEASYGHITKIPDIGLYNMGIDVKGDFSVAFEVDDKSKDTVKKLKELASRADEVILAADPDREGEAIAYHLQEQLGIPKKKIKRVTYTEVTKKAVEEALAHPRKIDMNLVDAAIGRAALDKIIGYRLSPIARRKVSARSIGRCQSCALKLIVERENEILAFDSKKYFEVWLPFEKNDKEYKAQYKGLIKNKKNTNSLPSKEEAEKVVNDCKGKDFIVNYITSKQRVVSPKPPFITSTFQQEASSKLGYPVKKSMDLCQKLFEGISIGGEHKGLVTYLRTDSTEMNEEFAQGLEQYIKDAYGDNYFAGKRKTKKSKNAQEGHECLRVVDLSMTPERLSSYIGDPQMIKVYTLIYNRTVASLMADAVIEDTDYCIVNGKHKFIYTEHAQKFDGFRKAYSLDDEELSKPIGLEEFEKIKDKPLEIKECETSPPKRYSEATLVAQLEKIGVGRPSTYASIVSILLDPGRGYCEEQGKTIAPTKKGMDLIKFTDVAFPDIINYEYSAQMEDSLDQIAKGKVKQVDFLKEFYKKLETSIKNANKIVVEKAPVEEAEGHTCPNCGRTLVVRNGRYGKFYACPDYSCHYTESIKK